MTLRIGITGGIGSGKTTIARIFETLRIPVYYADDAAKKIMNEDDSLKKQIIQHFGSEAYKEGKLDREYLSALVFRDSRRLTLLNSIVHPATIRNSNRWMKEQSGPYALREAALIFESGVQGQLDYVIGVSAPAELRIRRAMERDGISREKVLERMARQINESIKMKLCDFIIVNDERQPVIPQVLQLHRQLIAISSTLP
ncbi:MAG: dephospho-CoA kinase [Chitinophagaceae bacterium]|nr:dephospho-CoA kinase [Chitinophagaceae bacterium]